MKTIGAAFRESTTFKICFTSWLAVFVKYLGAGLITSWGTVPAMSATEFAASTAAILAIWVAREWRAAHYAE